MKKIKLFGILLSLFLFFGSITYAWFGLLNFLNATSYSSTFNELHFYVENDNGVWTNFGWFLNIHSVANLSEPKTLKLGIEAFSVIL